MRVSEESPGVAIMGVGRACDRGRWVGLHVEERHGCLHGRLGDEWGAGKELEANGKEVKERQGEVRETQADGN